MALAPSVWVAVDPSGSIEVRMPRLEMGQGIQTTIALLVADELAVDPGRLVVRAPATDEVPKHGRSLTTGGSASTSSLWVPLRTLAAAVREMLVAAAALRWQVSHDDCDVAEGFVVHRESGRRLAYGELVAAAARLPVPAEPTLRPQSEFRHIGKPARRLDGCEIARGLARYSADVRRPGQLFAVVARAPRLGATVASYDASAALNEPGVVAVRQLSSGIAVVAIDTWTALRARELLRVEWLDGPASDFSSASYEAELENALTTRVEDRFRPWRKSVTTALARSLGEPPRQALGDEPTLAADYATAWQTHAPMETWNAVARVSRGRCELWCGHQQPGIVVEHVARALRMATENVVVHPQPMGGGFGSRESMIYPLEAGELAALLPGRPVQVHWTRADDLQHAIYHPPSRHRLAGWLGRTGELLGWQHRIASPAIESRFGQRPAVALLGETSGAYNLVYRPSHLRVEYASPPVPVALGFWRGVEISSNVFAVESFLDELAHAAGRDPVEMRLRHLVDRVESPGAERPFDVSRLARTIATVAERAGWGSPLPPGRGRGIAAAVFDGRSAVATVAEVHVTDGRLTVDRILCALDCGIVVNPLGFESNAQGAVAWGLSALFSEITFAGGAVEQTSHLDYPLLRLPEMPQVEIIAVESDEPPSGSGEIPVPTIAPAVANAIFAASGVRLRRLPIRPGDLP